MTFLNETIGNPMVIADHNRGILFLGLGVFFAFVFLVGGGVTTATNGGYWTLVFCSAYLLGLAVLGIPVYRSTSRDTCPVPGSTSKSPATIRNWLPAFGLPLSLVLSMAFFRSNALNTELGMHLFMFGMGISLSLFVPLGLGMMSRNCEPCDPPEHAS